MSRLLIVAGCHRSGTSLVAKSLTCLGAELGKAADWKGPDNPTGFWEHQGILAINERALSLCGGRWDAPPEGIEEACRRIPDLIYLRGLGEHILRKELATHDVFALKDPRLCVLMPFWSPVLVGIGCEVSVVKAVRHPDAVAASLYRRDKMDRERALRLWLRYTEAKLDWPSVVVDYDAMVAEPIQQIARIGQRLNLPIDKQKAIQFATSFVREDLWHECTETPLPAEVSIVWQQMQRLSTEP